MSKDNFTVDRIQAIWNIIGGDGMVNQILAGKARLTVTPQLSEVLRVEVPPAEAGLAEFFATRPGFRVSKRFETLILSRSPTSVFPRCTSAFGFVDTLLRSGSKEIHHCLGKRYVFRDVDYLLDCIAALVESGFKGLHSALLEDGHNNIFYVGVDGQLILVDLTKFGEGNDMFWCCDASMDDNFQWDPGARLFMSAD